MTIAPINTTTSPHQHLLATARFWINLRHRPRTTAIPIPRRTPAIPSFPTTSTSRPSPTPSRTRTTSQTSTTSSRLPPRDSAAGPSLPRNGMLASAGAPLSTAPSPVATTPWRAAFSAPTPSPVPPPAAPSAAWMATAAYSCRETIPSRSGLRCVGLAA